MKKKRILSKEMVKVTMVCELYNHLLSTCQMYSAVLDNWNIFHINI